MHTLTCFFYDKCWFFVVFFSRLDSVGQLLSAHETHITSANCSHNSAPPTIWSDGFLLTTTSSCCCNVRSSSSKSSSTCCRNTRCGCITRCCNTLYRANITPVQAVIFWRRLPTAAAVLIPGSTSTHTMLNVDATFGQKMSPVWAYFTNLHRRFRPRDEPGQERYAACVAETARSVVCTPTTAPRP